MSIKVRYFASLKESIGRQEDILDFKELSTVNEIWRQANPGKPLPANTLAAVNMDYVELDSSVKDGDEVAFFPPVTGG
ncbi:MAG: MoaD/ThiS family protein [Methylococcales bacterium]|nr:MoaD/ThiS family protein [Methylococcales bacterium]